MMRRFELFEGEKIAGIHGITYKNGCFDSSACPLQK